MSVLTIDELRDNHEIEDGRVKPFSYISAKRVTWPDDDLWEHRGGLFYVPPVDLSIGLSPEPVTQSGWDRYGVFREDGHIRAGDAFGCILRDVTVIRDNHWKNRWHIEVEPGVMILESYRDGNWFSEAMHEGTRFHAPNGTGFVNTLGPGYYNPSTVDLHVAHMDVAQWSDQYAHAIHERGTQSFVKDKSSVMLSDIAKLANRFRVERLHFSTFVPATGFSPHGCKIVFDRSLDVVPHDLLSGSPYIVYCSRADAKSRRVRNEIALIEKLKQMFPNVSVVIHTGGTEKEQISLFRHARMIIGPHGAGLVNMLFNVGENCGVVEFLPQDYQHPMYHYFAKWRMMPYGRIIVPGDQHKDMIVPIDQFEHAVCAIWDLSK